MDKPIVHVLNLRSRTDRMGLFEQQAKEQEFDFMRWEGVVIENIPFKGISDAHRRIVQYAKNEGLAKITIAEDDIVWSAIGAHQYYLDNEPSEADLYLGHVYNSDIRDQRVIFGFSALTLYTVYERFYDTFLSMNPMNHLDRELGRFAHKYNYVVPPEFVCYQRDGYSDNQKKECTYGHLLEGKKLFGV